MATRDGGGLSAQPAAELSSDSESGSSYAGSGESGPHSSNSNCRWRTARFHDQECSRYFDCPSHIVERALSHSEEEDHEDEGENHHTQEHFEEERERQEERNDMEMEGEDGDHPSGPGTVSPVSDDNGSNADQRARSHMDVSPLPDAPTAETEQLPGGDDEIQITGSRIVLDGDEVDRPSAPTQARGTAENPIVLSDDSPPQTPSPQQPYTMASAASSSRAAPTVQQTTSSSSSNRPSRSDLVGLSSDAEPLTLGEFLATSSISRPSLARPAPRSPDFVLPRWQPDAEVTYCPICRTQFSIFVRKHHCRKCGRVVCNSCSPHRITIPYQYIVQPPNTPRQRYPSYQGNSDLSIVGGGERVRLCNPCVPDPNIAPPQQAQSAHSRSHSNLVGPFTTQDTSPSSNRWSSYFGGTTTSDLHARSRSVTMQHGGPSGSRGASGTGYDHSTENRILSGTPPVLFGHTSNFRRPAVLGMNYPQRPDNGGASSSRAGPSSSSAGPSNYLTARRGHDRPPPQPLAEEDECPVCHRELPPRTLANFEALREAHITICITSHSTYSGGVPADATAGGPGSPPLPPPPPRLTGMFPYAATEKDCVDSAECTICLEEFEVGVPMARLECLCRFHRVCITAWWERHPGRCPVHQHDGFGY